MGSLRLVAIASRDDFKVCEFMVHAPVAARRANRGRLHDEEVWLPT